MRNPIVQKLFDELHMIAQRNTDITQTEIDRISLLVEAEKGSLPELFVNVFQYLRSTHDDETGSANMFHVLRLVKILETVGEIAELSSKTETPSDGLLPMFELATKDKERIIHLCGKMRLIVLAASEFDEPHRRRLLNRIAAIEAEAHKPKGMFDVILGGVSDVGETLGKFGKDIKPLTDRMKEVAGIARKGTKEYDQIPAPEEIEKLPKPEDFEEE